MVTATIMRVADSMLPIPVMNPSPEVAPLVSFTSDKVMCKAASDGLWRIFELCCDRLRRLAPSPGETLTWTRSWADALFEKREFLMACRFFPCCFFSRRERERELAEGERSTGRGGGTRLFWHETGDCGE